MYPIRFPTWLICILLNTRGLLRVYIAIYTLLKDRRIWIREWDAAPNLGKGCRVDGVQVTKFLLNHFVIRFALKKLPQTKFSAVVKNPAMIRYGFYLVYMHLCISGLFRSYFLSYAHEPGSLLPLKPPSLISIQGISLNFIIYCSFFLPCRRGGNKQLISPQPRNIKNASAIKAFQISTSINQFR